MGEPDWNMLNTDATQVQNLVETVKRNFAIESTQQVFDIITHLKLTKREKKKREKALKEGDQLQVGHYVDIDKASQTTVTIDVDGDNRVTKMFERKGDDWEMTKTSRRLCVAT